jgi:hypothetical protein
MVNIICSEWIPLENIRFKIGYLLIGKWLTNPPEGGASGGPGMAFGDAYCVALRFMVCHYEYH